MGHLPVAPDSQVRRRARVGVAALAALVCPVRAEAPAGEPLRELPQAIRDALAAVRDFVPNIDQPGVLATFEFVKRSDKAPGATEAPIEVADWRDFVERPNDLRGRVVAVEGVVGRNKDPYALASRPDLGLFGQLELRRSDQPLTCTIICTADTGSIPVEASVRLIGFFVMVRTYRGPTGRDQHAALIVTTGPERMVVAGSAAAGGPPQWAYLAGAIVLGLVLTIVLLGRAQRSGPRDVTRLRAAHDAPMSLADDLAEWARRTEDEGPKR